MEWITILLESPKKRNSKSHVIKGIAKIENKLYLLDYVLFSSFEWWYATQLDSVEQYETIKNHSVQCETFYNSKNNTFYTYNELPENIQKLSIICEQI